MLLVGTALLLYAKRAGGTSGMVPFRGTPTKEMTDWAQSIVDGTAPFGTTIPRSFNGRLVLARVEHHTTQARTGKVGDFRGVTLYEPK